MEQACTEKTYILIDPKNTIGLQGQVFMATVLHYNQKLPGASVRELHFHTNNNFT